MNKTLSINKLTGRLLPKSMPKWLENYIDDDGYIVKVEKVEDWSSRDSGLTLAFNSCLCDIISESKIDEAVECMVLKNLISLPQDVEKFSLEECSITLAKQWFQKFSPSILEYVSEESLNDFVTYFFYGWSLVEIIEFEIVVDEDLLDSSGE